MNQKTISDNSTKTAEQVLIDSLKHVEQEEAREPYSCLLSEDLRIDQLYALRDQLVRKNRLLGDLKRQLLGAQCILTQLYCMIDCDVTATLQVRQQLAGEGISLNEYATGAMQELDSSSERMAYLVRQLQKDRLSPKF